MVPTSPWVTNRSMNDCDVMVSTSPWLQTGVWMIVVFWCPPRPGYKQEYGWFWCDDAHLTLVTNRSMNDCGVLMPTSPWVQTGVWMILMWWCPPRPGYKRVGMIVVWWCPPPPPWVQTGVWMIVVFWCPPRPGYKQEYGWFWCDDAHLALVTNRSMNDCGVLMPTSPWVQTGVWMILMWWCPPRPGYKQEYEWFVVFWCPPRPGYKQEYEWLWCDGAPPRPGYKQEYEWLWCDGAHLALVTNRSMNDLWCDGAHLALVTNRSGNECDVMMPTLPWLQTGVGMIVMFWCPPRPGYKQEYEWLWCDGAHLALVTNRSMNDCGVLNAHLALGTNRSMNDCGVLMPTHPGYKQEWEWMWCAWCPPRPGYKQE